MDETGLSEALRRATDDVTVPRDLVRHAERLGRERRARRRSVASALAVSVVVLAGGALIVTQGGGVTGSASSTSAGSAADTSAGGSDAAPAPAASGSPAPAPAPPEPAAGADGQAADEDATCDPALVVDGVPARSGYATPVRAGATVEIAGAPLRCAGVRDGARYTLVLAPRGSQSTTVLAEVAPAADGSFSVRVTVPATTAPGPARLSVEGSAWEQRPCPDTADCLTLDDGADLDVLPPGAPAGGSR